MQQVGAPLPEVADARGQPGRVQAQAQHVDRRCEQLGRDAAEQAQRGLVAGDQLPVAVDGERGVGLQALEQQVDGGARGGERGVVQRAFAKGGREAGRDQQCVALAQRHAQVLGQVQDHLAARL